MHKWSPHNQPKTHQYPDKEPEETILISTTIGNKGGTSVRADIVNQFRPWMLALKRTRKPPRRHNIPNTDTNGDEGGKTKATREATTPYGSTSRYEILATMEDELPISGSTHATKQDQDQDEQHKSGALQRKWS